MRERTGNDVDVKHNHEGRVCDPHCPAWARLPLGPITSRENAIAAGERARIVAWLRSFEVLMGGTLEREEEAAQEALLMVVADAIERGDHLYVGPNE